jgi:ATP-binding cassette, subfamily B, bacterial PglK
MLKSKNIFLLKVISKIWHFLEISTRTKFIFVIFLSFVNTILDLLGLGLFVPLILFVFKVESIKSNQYTSYIFNYFSFSSEINFIIISGIFFVLLLILKNILSLWINRYQILFSFNVFKLVSQNLFKYHISSRNFFLNDENSSEITREIYVTSLHFTEFILVSILTLLNELIIIIFIVGFLFIFSPVIVLLLFILLLPIAGLFYYKYDKMLEKTGYKENELRNDINATLYETVFGLPEIQIFQAKSFFYKKFNKLLKEFVTTKTKIFTVRLAPSKILEVLIFTGLVIILISGYIIDLKKPEMITLLSAFSLSAFRLLPSFNRITLAMINLKTYDYTLEILNKINTSFMVTNSNYFNQFNKLEITNLNYNYPNLKNQILKDISLEIDIGDVVGIKGSSGSGKSTLLKIIAGFIIPVSGELIVNNQENINRNLNSWQQKIGYVKQNVFLYNSSIKNNIAFGVDEENIDLVKLNLSINLAHLNDFILKNSDGIEYVVGENGSKLSGGQIQRIGIARAIYFDSEIILFDEPTSALDEDSQNKIIKTINDLSKNNFTIIIVSHQKSLLKNCNKLYEISNGNLKKIKI